MKKRNITLILVIMSLTSIFYSLFGKSHATTQADPVEPVYKYSLEGIDGKAINLADFKGKKILFVNVASECGYTPQYKELEELHQKYGSRLVIIGLPCNQFGEQEPGTEAEIAAFCSKNYGVTFLLTKKVEVKGDHQHPVYKWLTHKELNGKLDSEVKWNFQKYLVDENGRLIDVFYSLTSPMSNKITDLL